VIVTCPKCFSADFVTWQRLPDSMLMYTCSAGHAGDGQHHFVRPVSAAAGGDEAADEGVTDELLEPIASCVVVGEPFVEYGVVEYRLRQAFPKLFLAHVHDRGHVLTGKTIATASSVRFGVALGRLARTGELLSVYGPATGAWSYNGRVTYWARPPEPDGQPLTWAAYCTQHGRSPEWTTADRDEIGA
jgi:hypothetical protein